MGFEEQLVTNSESTVRASEQAGDKTFHLSFNKGPDVHGDVRHTETHVVDVKLPKTATNIKLHGPGEFTRSGKGKVYGVKISFTEEGKDKEHSRTIELPHPVTQVQLLDRKPDESYKAVA